MIAAARTTLPGISLANAQPTSAAAARDATARKRHGYCTNRSEGTAAQTNPLDAWVSRSEATRVRVAQTASATGPGDLAPERRLRNRSSTARSATPTCTGPSWNDMSSREPANDPWYPHRGDSHCHHATKCSR